MFREHGRRAAGQRLIVPALIASLALTVAACGGAATSTSTPAGGGAATATGASAGGGAATPTSAVLTLPPGAPSFTAPTLTFNIALTGAVPLSGSVSETVAPAYPPANRVCSDVTLADITFQGTVVSHELGLMLYAVNSSQTISAIRLDISSYLSIDSGEDSVFSPTPTDTSSTAKLNGDGTGSLMMAGWTSATGRMESGSITWTCSS